MDYSGITRLLEEWIAVPPPLTVIAEAERAALRSEFDPHIHAGWELKLLSSGELFLVVPGVPHEVTGICPMSLETGAGMFTLRFADCYLFFNRQTDGRLNFLPELFALLARIPEDEPRLREQLLEGKKVELGDLGFFYVRISGEGAPSAAEYNPAIYVKKLNVKWQCGARFKDLLGEAVFNLVAPRSVSQKVLKAHKAGETTVDISPEVTEEETDDQGGMGV